MQTYLSNSVEETERFAQEFGKTLKDGDCLAFFGDLGAGKTAFVRGLTRGLGIEAEVSSPTFALVHEYRGAHTLYHYDMYRVDSFDSLYSTGFFDVVGTDAILAVEWSENIEGALPSPYIAVTIESLGETQRRITIARNAG